MLLLLVGIISIFGSDYLVFGNALANMPFFVVGVILRENVKLSRMTISSDWRYFAAPLLMFLFIYMIRLSINFEHVFGYLFRFSLGVMGSLFVINISHAFSFLSQNKIKVMLLQTGYYSMTIYLFHPLFESTVRIGFLQVFKNIHIPFGLIASLAIICGVFFPLVLEKELLRKYSVTKRFILGLT